MTHSWSFKMQCLCEAGSPVCVYRRLKLLSMGIWPCPSIFLEKASGIEQNAVIPPISGSPLSKPHHPQDLPLARLQNNLNVMRGHKFIASVLVGEHAKSNHSAAVITFCICSVESVLWRLNSNNFQYYNGILGGGPTRPRVTAGTLISDPCSLHGSLLLTHGLHTKGNYPACSGIFLCL